MDEVKIVFARDAVLRRQLGGRVTIVWRRDGERFHTNCVKPRWGARQPDGVHLKFFVAIAAGRLVGCWDSEPYKRYSQTAKGHLDQHSYAAWLRDLAPAARSVLGVSRYRTVTLLQTQTKPTRTEQRVR